MTDFRKPSRGPSWLARALALGAITLASGTAALAQTAPAAGGGNTIKIGLVGPFSGGSSDFGIPMRNGVMLAVDEINALGGYVGRKFEVVMRDDKGSPDTARAASEELVKAGVVATIGFCNTGNALKSAEVFQKAQVPLIVPCATGTPVTALYPPKDSYIFRTSAKDSLQVPFVVNDAKVFTGDTLFKGSVGGTRGPGHATFAELQRSIVDVLLALPPETEVLPGHTEPTTVDAERRTNPFVRAWQGDDRVDERPCVAFGQPATLLLRAADYDGGTKCWVRFADGREDTVPGSAVREA